MARGGARSGAGRKPGVKLPGVADRDAAGRLLEALNRPEKKGKTGDSYEIQQWRALTEAAELSIRLKARIYLYDKRDGKAVQPFDFETPVSVIVDVSSAVTKRAAKRT